MFPIQVGSWDIRTWLARFEQESLLDRIRRLMPDNAEATRYGFRIEEVQPRFVTLTSAFCAARFEPCARLCSTDNASAS